LIEQVANSYINRQLFPDLPREGVSRDLAHLNFATRELPEACRGPTPCAPAGKHFVILTEYSRDDIESSHALSLSKGQSAGLDLIQSSSAQSSEQAFHGMIRSDFGTLIPQFLHRDSFVPPQFGRPAFLAAPVSALKDHADAAARSPIQESRSSTSSSSKLSPSR
jgi:hypothetical protein